MSDAASADNHEYKYELESGRYYVGEIGGRLRAIDLKTGEHWRHSTRGRSEASAFRMSPAGRYAVRYDGHGETHLVEVRTGEFIRRLDVDPRFSTDGRHLIDCDKERTALRVWELGRDKPVGSLKVCGGGNNPRGGDVLWGLSPRNDFLFASTPGPQAALPEGAACGQFTVWTFPALERRCVISWSAAKFRHELRPFAFSPDGATLAAWPGDGLQFWDLASGKCVGTASVEKPSNAMSAPHVAWSPDGKRFATVSEDRRTLRVSDPAAKQLWAADARDWIGGAAGRDDMPGGPVFSGDSRRLVMAIPSGVVCLDASTGYASTETSALPLPMPHAASAGGGDPLVRRPPAPPRP